MERSRSRCGGVYLYSSLIPLLLLMGATSTGTQSISMAGYDLSTAVGDGSPPDKVKGNVLLLDNAVQSLGIIFAFSVLVGSPSPFIIQVYHVDVPGKTYHMGQQFNITPSVQKGREDIYIESLLNRPCIVVRPGDRLALYATSDNPSVQANFNASSQLMLCQQSGMNLACDQTFPYSIRAAAYYIVSNSSSLNLNSSTSSDAVTCPYGTLIPAYSHVTTIATTTVPLITGLQGAMGATGSMGGTGFTGSTGVSGSLGSIGSTGALGLGHPGMQGINGATGWTGLMGAIGATGSTGSTGSSEIGDLGVPGARGPPGLMGDNFTVFLKQPVPPKQATQLSDESSDSTDPFWSSSRAIWATYLWLAIVSLLILIVVIIVIVVASMQRSFNSHPLGTSPVTAESRKNIMDDDAPSNYSDLGSIEH